MIPAFQGVDHIHVYVVDRAAAEKWYASVLGFARIPDLEFWSAGGGPLTLTDPSGSVHLAIFEKAAEKCRSVIALKASAAEFVAWQAHLAAALGRPVDAVDHKVAWSLYFADPDGNPYEITSYEHADVASRLRSKDG